MPIFTHVSLVDRSARLAKPAARQVSNEYSEGILGMQLGETYELSPEGTVTLRGLKVNVKRAANSLREAGKISFDVNYGETVEGTLLVWPEINEPKPVRKPRKSKNGTETASE